MDIVALQLQLRESFRVEAADLLAELDSSMLELESSPKDPALLNRVFRAIHTIKGSGATAGFNEMAAFTHHVEELFDEARLGHLTITPEMIDLALQAKDLIGELLESDGPEALEAVCNQVVEALAKYIPHKVSTIAPQAKSGARAPTQRRYQIFFRPHPQVFSSGTDPAHLVEELGTLGVASVVATLDRVPPLASLDPELCYLAWQVDLVSAQPLGRIREIFAFVEDESELRIEGEAEGAASGVEPTGPLAAYLNIAAQSLEAIGGFLLQLPATPETAAPVCRNYLRILGTFRAAALHQRQDATVALLAAQIQLLEEVVAGTVKVSAETKLILAEGFQKLETAIRSPAEAQPDAVVATPAALASAGQAAAEPGPTPQPAAAPPEALAKESARPAATIRVDQEKLDRLMRAAGELLVARNAFPVLAKRLTVEHGLSGMGKEVRDAGNHISHIADDLQAAVMSIRMMPIRSVYQRFPRLVRDICRAQNKEAELVLEGEDTELDKTVIEQIADPLVHLVRNAVDHGIEAPEIRIQTNKPRSGKVTLKAYNRGNNVVLEVSDDGRGMDPERLKRKALDRGVISEAEAEAMNDSAALDLIFLPGFSTADKVTDISGRGVGMDVVRSNIRNLHGTTTLESRLGLGSRITITLPASLMVSKGILVEADGEEYVFPIESVLQMVNLPRDRVHRHENTHFATFRNEVYPIIRLADHFASADPSRPIAWRAEVPLAIVQTNRGKVGVAVDRFVSDVEVIVKPMGRDFANISAFQGATIMGDGRVALVINPAGFI